MAVGNIPLFTERQELEQNDIVSYSFGDQGALYLRGQWTFHRNTASVSSIWKSCPHLSDGLQKELLLKVAWTRRMQAKGLENYPRRFNSAEGCYSRMAMARSAGLKVKIANKQFSGLTVPADHSIYHVSGSVWQCPRDALIDVSELRRQSHAGY